MFAQVHAFLKDRSGVAATAYAVMSIPLTGAIGFMVDYSRTLGTRSQLQQQADAAALNAAMLPSWASDSERASAARMMFTGSGTAGATVTVATVNGVTTVEATLPVKTTVASIIGIRELSAKGKGSATKTRKGPPACVLALNRSANDAIVFSGSTLFEAKNCAVYSNSTSPSALSSQGGASVKAPGFCAVGGSSGSFTPSPQTNCKPAEDPFYNLAKPAVGACTENNYKIQPNKTANMNPGVYCGGIDIQGTAKLKDGVYIVVGELSIGSQAKVTGDNITFFLTGSSAGFKVNGGSTLTLTAPTTGTYAGVLIYQDRTANVGAGNTLNGDSSTSLTGAIYTPTQTLTINGSGSFGQGNAYMPLIADQLKFSGNATSRSDGTAMPNGAPLPTMAMGARITG